ncbi:MAG: hypothetical protein M3Z89_14570 [Lysinibacillus fusiformis]|nr:hypothetical protein [Lysinibacillus fusiformis]MCT6933657.1 hypothetical protein [Lysinibacillus fusiformis]
MFFKKFCMTACCSVLLAGSVTLGLESANATALENSYKDQYLNELGISENSDSYKLLIAIDKMPAELVEQEAGMIAEWISNESGIEVIAQGDNLLFPTLMNEVPQIANETEIPLVTTFASWTDIANCAGAIGLAIFANALPIAKLAKIKDIFKALGGATRAVEMIYTNYKYYRSKNKTMKTSLDNAITDIVNKNSLGKEAKQLLLEFFGINSVIGGCSNVFSYELKVDKNDLNSKMFV